MRHRGTRGKRRRKPVVVVTVAAAVLLVAGGIAATRAGAQETPQWPAVPGFSLSDLPGFSGFGDDADDGGPAAGPAPQAGDPGDDSAAGNTGHADAAGDPGTDPAPAVRHAPARDPSDAGNDDDSAGRVRADPVAPDAAHGVPEKPDRPKAAAVPVKPRPAMDRQDAGGGLIAAAKQDVTAADISQSPSAPTQQQILSLINGNRREHGCDAVTLDRRLIEAANGHAADMARHDYFAHESPNGEGAGDRVTGAGYNWRHYGENIARGVDSAYEVVDGWMHSPEHRHNILDCSLEQMGVGIAIAGDGKHTVYWVQDFATPM